MMEIDYENKELQVWMLIWSYWPGPQGGAERQCRLISPYLYQEGVKPTIITSRFSYGYIRKEVDGNIPVIRLGFFTPLLFTGQKVFTRLFLFLSGLCRTVFKKNNREDKDRIQDVNFWVGIPFVRLARLLFMFELFYLGFRQKKSFDCIHVHETGWLGAVGCLLGRFLQKPVVCKAATTPVFPLLGWDVPLRLLLRKVQRSCHLIVLNDFAVETLKGEKNLKDRISVIPNSVHLPSTIAEPEKSDIVLYVGNLNQGALLKGFDILFSAWSLVVKKKPGLRLVVVGGGDSLFWRNRLEGYGCGDSVSFDGFQEGLDSYYQNAGIFVLPSRIEGMSNALLEAGSFGLPIIASDIDANRAVIDQDVGTGILVETGNAEALADAIIELASSPSLRKKLGKKGRDIVESRYQCEVVASKMCKLYRRLVFNKQKS